MFTPTRDRCAAAAEAVRASVQRVIETLESRTMLAATVDGDVLRVEGTGGDDTITVGAGAGGTGIVVDINGTQQTFNQGNLDRIRISAGGGDDEVEILTENGELSQRVVISGGSGNDTLAGGDGAEVIRGDNGHDEIDGNRRNDTIEGGDGNDILFGGSGRDDIRGDDGHDRAYGGGGEDTLRGNDGNDTLGGDSEDRLNALDPDLNDDTQDVFRQEGDDDKLSGGDGDDWLLGGIQSDYDPNFTEGGVDPKPFDPGNNGSDTMTGGAGNDVIDARGRDDVIRDKTNDDVVPIERYINFVEDPDTFQDEDYAFHNHAQMQILVDGQNVEMPRGLGEFADPDNNLYPLLHKHWDPDNLQQQLHQIHMHSVLNNPIRGRDVFQAWGVSFSRRHIGQYHVNSSTDITVDVNGNAMTISEFAGYAIQDADEIEINLTTT